MSECYARVLEKKKNVMLEGFHPSCTAEEPNFLTWTGTGAKIMASGYQFLPRKEQS